MYGIEKAWQRKGKKIQEWDDDDVKCAQHNNKINVVMLMEGKIYQEKT